VIDLHLHTTASDGRSAPDALVREAAAAGIVTLAVTDHDTVAAVPVVMAAAVDAGVAAIAGIEITAVHQGRDVHVLGYFVDPDDVALGEFLGRQREDRRRRVLEIGRRLDRLGAPIDLAPVVGDAASSGRALGRPAVAAALVAAGHARDISDAFDRYLAEGRPAFVERHGASPADVVLRIGQAGGLASLAHPGKLKLDALIPAMIDAGLSAIEVFHPDHTADDVARYRRIALETGVIMTGGSDYHGLGSGRANSLGRVGMPAGEFERLAARVSGRLT
jgi:hypothetical protein